MPFDWPHLPTTANQLHIRLHMLELTIGKDRRVTQYMHKANSCSVCRVSALESSNISYLIMCKFLIQEEITMSLHGSHCLLLIWLLQ